MDEKGAFRKIVHLRGLTSYTTAHDRLANESYCYYGFGKIGKVFTHDIKPEQEIGYNKKSQTWVRSAEKVHAMLDEVEKEKKDPLANPRPFNIFGKKSIFAKEVNTFKINDSLVQEIYKENPDYLTRLWDYANQRVEEASRYRPHSPISFDFFYGWVGKWDLIAKNGDSYEKNLGKYPSSTCYGIELGKKEWRLAYEKSNSRVGWSFFKDATHNDAYQGPILCKSLLTKISEKRPDLNERIAILRKSYEKSRHDAANEVMKLIYESVELVRLQPDSCFTWSRQKLSIIDVDLEDKWFESIISPTKAFLE